MKWLNFLENEPKKQSICMFSLRCGIKVSGYYFGNNKVHFDDDFLCEGEHYSAYELEVIYYFEVDEAPKHD